MMETNNKIGYGVIFVAIFAAIVFAGCALFSKKNATEHADALIIIDAPKVVWSQMPEGNRIYVIDDVRFKISDEYFSEPRPSYKQQQEYFLRFKENSPEQSRDYVFRGGDYAAGVDGVYLSFPELIPLSKIQKECLHKTPMHISCEQNMLQLGFSHHLTGQGFKKDGVDESNYLNYFIDPERSGYIGERFNNPTLTEVSRMYGLDAFHSKIIVPTTEVSDKQIDDYFFLKKHNNIEIAIQCTNRNVTKPYYLDATRIVASECRHQFIYKPEKLLIDLVYRREYLPQWKSIQKGVLHLIEQFHQSAAAQVGG